MPLKTASSANTVGLLALWPRRSHCFLRAHLSVSQDLSIPFCEGRRCDVGCMSRFLILKWLPNILFKGDIF